ncbi:trimeric LpxA-like protein [Aspergillus costaricaensis CBS 115574]|uniref:Trimeric LpxA-like protein n=1 Tax=Aspergillus costaricaensis CBS 115574 TaxID=1448317 RepID=A0ACD1II61_9EURO|nr:trimeric LpxA-like protein [Aspergillus costaricaensis CBS 115574]RAK89479.1 trimeric LpxA-like protein [Aspergillus costaricaensis CBS 115574]
MDPRQHQQSSTTSTHLKPPPSTPHSQSHHSHQQRPPSTPSSHHHRTPITAHPSATISESLLIQGSHPISIGASTIIHPRARIYSYEGPVIIGNGCIISEKSVIGSAPTTSTSTTSTTSTSSGIASKDEGSILPIRISNSVTIGPGAQILPGAHIHSASCVEARAVIGRRSVVGSHCRVCAGVEVADGDAVADWMVVWGGGNRRRRRAVGRVEPSKVVFPAGGNGVGGLEGRVIEEARLMVLQRERDALVRLIGGRRR